MTDIFDDLNLDDEPSCDDLWSMLATMLSKINYKIAVFIFFIYLLEVL